MSDDELIALASKAGIYWASGETAYMHPDTMRAFADAIADATHERCAVICDGLSAAAGRRREAVGSLEGDTGYECADAIRKAAPKVKR